MTNRILGRKSDWPISKINASISLRNAVGYWRDLRKFKQGDKGRFERMVDNQGKRFPSATPADWEQRIRATAHVVGVRVYFQRRCDVLLKRVG